MNQREVLLLFFPLINLVSLQWIYWKYEEFRGNPSMLNAEEAFLPFFTLVLLIISVVGDTSLTALDATHWLATVSV